MIDGTQFDSSYDRKEPTTFRANQVIKGWTEALTMMPVGSKWELYIPQDLAYGAREAGQIKPFSTLIFEVELVGIENNLILIRFTKKRGTFVSHAFLLTCPSTNQIFFSFISVRASTTFTT